MDASLADVQRVLIETRAMETARKLCSIDTAKLAEVIRWRHDRDGELAGIAPAADLVSRKSAATLQLLIFVIGELRATVPTHDELRAGTAQLLERMTSAVEEIRRV